MNHIILPQDHDTPLQSVETKSFSYEYACMRATETRAAEEVSQDFLAAKCDYSTFVFSLCDGVSQSFYGDFAARFLGEALAQWLWDKCPESLTEANIARSLTSFLSDLTGTSTKLVMKQVLPTALSAIVREVLEQKRIMGSESTFACGRIDLPAQSNNPGRLVLAWLGDSRLRVWGPAGENKEAFQGAFITAERWSTKKGIIGTAPHIYVQPLYVNGKPNVHTVVAYSDGLTELDQVKTVPSAKVVSRAIEDSGSSPYSDDISYLNVSWTIAQTGRKLPMPLSWLKKRPQKHR